MSLLFLFFSTIFWGAVFGAAEVEMTPTRKFFLAAFLAGLLTWRTFFW